MTPAPPSMTSRVSDVLLGVLFFGSLLALGAVTIALSDYRAVGGLRVPHSERASFDGVDDPALTRTLQTITLDAPLDAALFSRGGGE